MESASASTSRQIQQVSKASSDEILRKFADAAEVSARKIRSNLRVSPARRKKRSSRRPVNAYCFREADLFPEMMAERKSLLQRHSPPTRRSAALRVRVSEKAGARDAFLHALEKTWSKLVEGRMPGEGDCIQHVRLIADAP
ncbi:uncharacterized protein LOC144701818 [Wolffia australiana]